MDPTADLLRAVADQIEQHPDWWDQGNYGTGEGVSCQTPACVAGWACAIAAPSERGTDQIHDDAAELLGLDDDAAWAVFLHWEELFPDEDKTHPPSTAPFLRALADLPAPRTEEQVYAIAGVER